MGKTKYTEEERTFVRLKVKEGIHPKEFLDGFNLVFSKNISFSAIKHLCYSMNLQIKGLLKKEKKTEEKEIDLAEKQDIQKLKSQLTTLTKKEALEERLIKVIKENISTFKPVTFFPTKKPSIKINESLGMLLADLHIGEVVSKEEMGGFAEYNFEIFKERFDRYINKTLKFSLNTLAGYNFDELVIWMLGDFVSGGIHDELTETADLVEVEQVLNGAEIIAGGLRELCKNFKKVRVIGVVGNHGRLTKKKKFKKIYNNWDYVIYHVLKLALDNQKNISFKIPKSFFSYDEVNKFNFLSMHGSNVRSWNQIPWYGINRMEAEFGNLLASQEKYFNYLLLAHFHTSSSIDRVRGEKIISGSFVGADEFSLGAMTSVKVPRQLIFGVHEKYGISWRLPVNLV